MTPIEILLSLNFSREAIIILSVLAIWILLFFIKSRFDARSIKSLVKSKQKQYEDINTLVEKNKSLDNNLYEVNEKLKKCHEEIFRLKKLERSRDTKGRFVKKGTINQ